MIPHAGSPRYDEKHIVATGCPCSPFSGVSEISKSFVELMGSLISSKTCYLLVHTYIVVLASLLVQVFEDPSLPKHSGAVGGLRRAPYKTYGDYEAPIKFRYTYHGKVSKFRYRSWRARTSTPTHLCVLSLVHHLRLTSVCHHRRRYLAYSCTKFSILREGPRSQGGLRFRTGRVPPYDFLKLYSVFLKHQVLPEFFLRNGSN
jgi:hypothetical protein